jgi:hypothetical protein
MTQDKVLLCAFAAAALATLAGAGERAARVDASSGPPLREWTSQVERLLTAGELAVRLTRDDTMIPGRRHERLAQLHRGIRVFGGELARQSDASGPPPCSGRSTRESTWTWPRGSLPRRSRPASPPEAGAPFGARGGPELLVLPLEGGGYRLAYRTRAFFEAERDLRQSFLDAATGEILREYSDLQKQSAGTGTGVLGDRKKISVAPGGRGFTTTDRLRPPAISTYDFRFSINRLNMVL